MRPPRSMRRIRRASLQTAATRAFPGPDLGIIVRAPGTPRRVLRFIPSAASGDPWLRQPRARVPRAECGSASGDRAGPQDEAPPIHVSATLGTLRILEGAGHYPHAECAPIRTASRL